MDRNTKKTNLQNIEILKYWPQFLSYTFKTFVKEFSLIYQVCHPSQEVLGISRQWVKLCKTHKDAFFKSKQATLHYFFNWNHHFLYRNKYKSFCNMQFNEWQFQASLLLITNLPWFSDQFPFIFSFTQLVQKIQWLKSVSTFTVEHVKQKQNFIFICKSFLNYPIGVLLWL